MKYLFFTFIIEIAFPICISLICPFPFHLTLMGKMVKVTTAHGSWNFYKQAFRNEIRFLAVRPKKIIEQADLSMQVVKGNKTWKCRG